MKRSFKDATVIVTGGASGIGRALCEALGGRGAIVTVADIDAEAARNTAAAVSQAGGKAVPAHLDVAQAGHVQELVDRTVSTRGRLDYMFNNAGLAVGGEMQEIGFEHWRRIVEVNLMGTVYGTRAAYRAMIDQGSGHIVNVASVSGMIGHPTAAPYAATKAAIVGLTTSLRAEAAALGVKVTAVCPAFIKTAMFDSATVVNAAQEAAVPKLPFKMMGPGRAAEIALRGVEKNRGIVVFPFYAWIMWWLYRIHPALTAPISKKMVEDFRAVRHR